MTAEPLFGLGAIIAGALAFVAWLVRKISRTQVRGRQVIAR